MIVSVVMITYGHEKFIKEAVQGILIQDGDFDIELVLANDNSPDYTDKIINEIVSNNKSKVKINYTKHPENLGMISNFFWAIKECNGKYIAICDGDDFWIDPLKLKKQVDILENDPNLSFCFHTVNIVDEDGVIIKNDISPANFYGGDVLFSSQRILAGPMVSNPCSLIFRNSDFVIDSLLNMPNLPYGDKPLEKILAIVGDGHFIKESMANYRIFSGSVTNSENWRQNELAKSKENHLKLYSYLFEICDHKLLKKVIYGVIKSKSENNLFFQAFSASSLYIVYIYSERKILNFLYYFSKYLFDLLKVKFNRHF